MCARADKDALLEELLGGSFDEDSQDGTIVTKVSKPKKRRTATVKAKMMKKVKAPGSGKAGGVGSVDENCAHIGITNNKTDVNSSKQMDQDKESTQEQLSQLQAVLLHYFWHTGCSAAFGCSAVPCALAVTALSYVATYITRL